MISAFSNTFKIPELRERILFTLAMVAVVRLGTTIPLPGIDPSVLQEWLSRRLDLSAGEAAITALLNVFSGGGLQQCALFALGIMPYISASIMMQLLTAVVPSLSKLAREDGGRQKINMYTRYVTIVLCLIQGYFLAKSLIEPGNNPFLPGLQTVMNELGRDLVPGGHFQFIFITVLTITGGTMLLMWIGEQVTERGIGNGISLIIAVNIVSALPGALVQVWKSYIGGSQASPMNAMILVLLVAFLIAVIAGVIALTQAQRRISVQYAKRVVGRKVYGGQTQFLPLKVNYAGVMPIIFAQAILLFPSQMIGFAFPHVKWLNTLAVELSQGWPYYVISALLIFFFSYFWVATMFQPNQISEDLKKNGGYVPGVRPGKPTADFLDHTMSRLTFAGAAFLTIIYLIPVLLARLLKVDPVTAQFFGGTSLLILVGVVLDVMRQVETHLLQRHYDGFLRKGKIRGRFEKRPTGAGGATAGKNTVLWLWVGIAIIVVIGMAYSIFRETGP